MISVFSPVSGISTTPVPTSQSATASGRAMSASTSTSDASMTSSSSLKRVMSLGRLSRRRFNHKNRPPPVTDAVHTPTGLVT